MKKRNILFLGIFLLIFSLIGSNDISILAEDNEIVVFSEIPEYTENPYVELNGNIPEFTEEDLMTEEFETYSELDSLGRCGTAYANICIDIMPQEERGQIGSVKPSGWHTIKYEGIDGNYLYNRCHLIAYELAAENANEQNLITGTRYLNIQGMLPYENQVADYVEETENHVLYRVTPVFEDENLVASGVQIEAFSVEDSGMGICFNVYCYNVQPGIEIDYLTGDSWQVESEELLEEETVSVNDNDKSVESEVEGGSVYVLNTNTMKFHYSYCSSVSQMSEKNKQDYNGNREDLIEMGYEPCKRCNP